MSHEPDAEAKRSGSAETSPLPLREAKRSPLPLGEGKRFPLPLGEGQGEGSSGSQKELTPDSIMDALKDVYDPELAIDIVSLGLIYGVEIEGKNVHILMTLTSPGCPIGPMLQTMAHGAVKRAFPEVADVQVELVWSPPWDPYKMASEEAKDMLGIW